jgi:hypothetical protein
MKERSFFMARKPRLFERTGALWEGRFKCSLIDGELYFLTCLQYIEMNPVRAWYLLIRLNCTPGLVIASEPLVKKVLF